MADSVEDVNAYLEKQAEHSAHDHENLAEEMLGEGDGVQEHTQELITAIETKDRGWLDIKMGTLELAFGDVEGEVEWEAELVVGGTWGGFLTDIIGFKSLG
jgi:hypothetical protein